MPTKSGNTSSGNKPETKKDSVLIYAFQVESKATGSTGGCLLLDRTHIQSLLNHKQKQRINKWLKDLIRKQYVARIYDNAIIGKNRRSANFLLTYSGVRFVKSQGIYDETFIHKLYWDKKREEAFIQHCLLTATICCELEKKNRDGIQYQYGTESDFSSVDSPFHFLKNSQLAVDLVFWKKEKGKKRKKKRKKLL